MWWKLIEKKHKKKKLEDTIPSIRGAVENLNCFCGYSQIEYNHFEARRFAAHEDHLRKVKNYKKNGTERCGDKTKRFANVSFGNTPNSWFLSHVECRSSQDNLLARKRKAKRVGWLVVRRRRNWDRIIFRGWIPKRWHWMLTFSSRSLRY